MKKFNEYADSFTEFAEPYAKRTSRFFCDAKDAIEDKYYHEKKKYIRKRRINKIKNALEGTLGAVILVITVVAGVFAVAQGAHRILSGGRLKCTKNKKHENHSNNGSVKIKEKKKKDNSSGYITL